MRAIITLPDHMHARAKQRAAELGISFAEFARRLFERELDTLAPQGRHQLDLRDSCRDAVRHGPRRQASPRRGGRRAAFADRRG